MSGQPVSSARTGGSCCSDRADDPASPPDVLTGILAPFCQPNLDLDLVQVPLVTGTRQPPTDPVCEALAELEAPLPHGLVAHDDATGGQHLLDHAQAQRET